jgi:Fe-S-cluster containining protein
MDNKDICKACGGICCSFESMDISFRSMDIDDPDEIDKWFEESDTRWDQLITDDDKVPDMTWIVTKNGDGLHLRFKCNHRTDEGLCGIYNNRPDMCKKFECSLLRVEDMDEKDEEVDEKSIKAYKAIHSPPDYEVVKDVTEKVNACIREAIAKQKQKLLDKKQLPC